MGDLKPRVLIFSTAYLPLVGGAEVAMNALTDRLTDWEFDLICARLKPALASSERIGNVNVHRIGFGNSIDKYLLPFLGPFVAVRFARPTVLWSLMASYGGFAALVYKRLHPKTPFLLTLQEGDPLEHYAKRAGRFHEWIFRNADSVQAISTFLGAWATRMGFRGTPVIIPNGVHVQRFMQPISPEERLATRAVWGVESEKTVIVTTSRLSLKNGVDDLIVSLTHLPESCVLVIAGDGEDREKLERLVRDLKLEKRVTFLGTQPHDRLPAILQSAEFFCRPSLSEGLGISFLEAMAAGIPIIATPVGGIPDFLTDGVTGLFCSPRDPASIAVAVQKYLADPARNVRIAHAGQALVNSRYQWADVAWKVETLLKELSHS